jgi:hypothetical protein
MLAYEASQLEWGSGGRGFKSRSPDFRQGKARWHLRSVNHFYVFSFVFRENRSIDVL